MSSILDVDKNEYAIRQIVASIHHHILRDYIAPVNEREVLSNLYNFLKDGDVTLISKQQLKVYQEFEKQALDNALFQFPIIKE